MKTTTAPPKKQTRKLHGNVMNYLMGNNATLPVVGKGATIMHYSDRSCAEVVEVSADGKTVKLEHLDATGDKTREGGMGHQNWILTPTRRYYTIIWRQGAWRTINTQIVWTEETTKMLNALDAPSAEHKLLYAECFDSQTCEMKLVAGKTRTKITYNKINILFGVKQYYYDWEF